MFTKIIQYTQLLYILYLNVIKNYLSISIRSRCDLKKKNFKKNFKYHCLQYSNLQAICTLYGPDSQTSAHIYIPP